MIPSWLRRLIRQNPAVAPRSDPPPLLAEAAAAAKEATRRRREVEAREPTVLEVARELRTQRVRNHIPQRLESLWQERRA